MMLGSAIPTVFRGMMDRQMYPAIEQGYGNAGIPYDRSALPQDYAGLLGVRDTVQQMQPQQLPPVGISNPNPPYIPGGSQIGGGYPANQNWRDLMQQMNQNGIMSDRSMIPGPWAQTAQWMAGRPFQGNQPVANPTPPPLSGLPQTPGGFAGGALGPLSGAFSQLTGAGVNPQPVKNQMYRGRIY